MALYSTQLGQLNLDTADDHVFYTVGAGQGPAIVKACQAVLQAGQHAQLALYDGGDDFVILDMDNSAGGSAAKYNLTTWCVIPPGLGLSMYLFSAIAMTALVSGYQFSAP